MTGVATGQNNKLKTCLNKQKDLENLCQLQVTLTMFETML